jgi:hypothetical protein
LNSYEPCRGAKKAPLKRGDLSRMGAGRSAQKAGHACCHLPAADLSSDTPPGSPAGVTAGDLSGDDEDPDGKLECGRAPR